MDKMFMRKRIDGNDQRFRQSFLILRIVSCKSHFIRENAWKLLV